MAINTSAIIINASKQNVWESLTQPQLVKQWQYGSDLTTTWEPRTPIRFRTVWEDTVFEQWGQVLEVQPTGFLKYTLFAPRPGLEDKPENYFTMLYRLSGENGQVKLEIIQEDNRPGAVEEAPQGDENGVLQALKKVAEAV
ncbi:MAG TPA: SRPBCC domain-containing protein [Chitinophagaceae bacterium]|nr:SRPBCC domain-containing protein [Chitinophagaceae bacterium]